MNNAQGGGAVRRLVRGYVCGIDALNARLGRGLRWCLIGMTAMTLLIIFLGLFFRVGRVWMAEVVVYLHGILFMLAAADALRCDAHVRIDIFYSRMSVRGRARVNLIGVFVFLLPVCAVILFTSFPYVAASWAVREESSEGEGLAAVFLLKSCLLLFPLLMSLQGLSLAGRSWLLLSGGESESGGEKSESESEAAG